MNWMGRAWRALRHVGICVGLALLASCGGGGNEASDTLGRLLADDVSTFRGNGTWWNPAEPGTGFFFEAQGGVAIVSFFVYDEEGEPVWYSASGAFTDGGAGRHNFIGELQFFEGGPVINQGDSRRLITSSKSAGTVTIAFESGDRASVQLPKRSFQAVKFATRAAQAPAGAVVPETGVFWDPSRSGTGFTVEVDGSSVTVGIYGFTRSGRPAWRLAVGELKAGMVTVRPTIFHGGQTLDGAYKAPVGAPGESAEDDVIFQFESPCWGAISLNGSLAVERFAFNGAGCRTPGSARPADRLVLPPDLAGSTAFTPLQLRAMAGRALQLVDVLVDNESLATVFYNWQKELAPGLGEGGCPAGGYAYWENTDADKSNSLTKSDVFLLDLYACRFRLPYPGGTVDTSLEGVLDATLQLETDETFSTDMRYWWLLRESKTSAFGLDGAVTVRAWREYWFTNQVFNGLDILTIPDGWRTHVYSGTGRRHGLPGYGADVYFETLYAALPVSQSQRILAVITHEGQPLRVTAVGDLDHAPGQFTQGVLNLNLEPTKAAGTQVKLRVAGPDQLVLEHWRGTQLLSSQNVTHRMLREAAAGLQ